MSIIFNLKNLFNFCIAECTRRLTGRGRGYCFRHATRLKSLHKKSVNVINLNSYLILFLYIELAVDVYASDLADSRDEEFSKIKN